jgi:hypothetical protein
MPFLQSSQLGPPSPSPAGECALTPLWFRWGGGARFLAGEEVGESQFGRGDRQCGILYILYTHVCTLCLTGTARIEAPPNGRRPQGSQERTEQTT